MICFINYITEALLKLYLFFSSHTLICVSHILHVQQEADVFSHLLIRLQSSRQLTSDAWLAAKHSTSAQPQSLWDLEGFTCRAKFLTVHVQKYFLYHAHMKIHENAWK